MNDKRKKQDSGMSIYEMKRLPPIVMVDRAKIESRYDKKDESFTRLYVNHLKGKKKAALTRFSISRITPGFYEEKPDGSLGHTRNKLDVNDIKSVAMSILAGGRSELFIYKHPKLNSDSFLCPDDEVVYEAYSQLGLVKVPVVLLDYDDSDLEESAIIIQIRWTPKGIKQFFDKPFSHKFSSIPTFLGLESSKSFSLSMNLLIERASETLEKLRNFHISGHLNIHYHHTLASILHRVIQSINAIKLLAAEKLYDQAYNQIRVLYELSLNFYLDWLAPEKIGPYLQLYDISSKQDWKEFKEGVCSNARKDGWDNELIQLQRKADNKLGELLNKVSEKAALNPINSKHKELYKFLSRIAHQDFNITAKYSYLLESNVDKSDSNDLHYIRLYTDVIVAQVVTRISSDIGGIEDVTSLIGNLIRPNNSLESDG